MPAMLQYKQLVSKDGTLNGIAKIGEADGCSHFNLVSWKLGCASTYAACQFNITGMRLDHGQEVPVVSKVFVVPQAEKATGNTLKLAVFGTDDFSHLSSVTVQLQVGDSLDQPWWSDDFSVTRVCSDTPLCKAAKVTEKPTEKLAERPTKKAAEKAAEKPAEFWRHNADRVV